MKSEIVFNPIAYIVSPYTSKFGIPRQSGLVKSVQAKIRFEKSEQYELALRGLEEFSHLWVLFVFHSLKTEQWKPLVAPPRFADSKKIGALATRTPFRPNPIGQSVVKLEQIIVGEEWIDVLISGGDFLHDTPVLDIKPYIPYADCVLDAKAAWAAPVLPVLQIHWSEDALLFLEKQQIEHLRAVIEETLSYDPRPGYERGNRRLDGQKYFVEIENFDVCWVVQDQVCEILEIIQKNNG